MKTVESLSKWFDARFAKVEGIVAVKLEELPALPRRVLGHDEHMTDVVQRQLDEQVTLNVLQTKREGALYGRRICLMGTQGPLLHAMVRMDVGSFSNELTREIVAEQRPLGTLLMESGMRTRVSVQGFFRVDAAIAWATWLGVRGTGLRYGRAGVIYCDDVAAIEVVEVLAQE